MEDKEQRPLGALLVVGVLTAVILVMWFGVFLVHLARG
jgi:hypothetical protein